MNWKPKALGWVVAFVCSWSCAAPAALELGPQTFTQPSIESSGASDPDVASAVDAAVTVARGFGFRYDASGSMSGRVVVTALAQGEPVTLTMRFFKQGEALVIASMTSQSGTALLQNAGGRVEDQFYGKLVEEARHRRLQIVSDPNAFP